MRWLYPFCECSSKDSTRYIGVGDSLEALLGACLLQQVARFQPALDRLWDVLGFVALAALFATTLGAMMGVASLWWGEVLDPSQGIPIW